MNLKKTNKEIAYIEHEIAIFVTVRNNQLKTKSALKIDKQINKLNARKNALTEKLSKKENK